MELFAVDGKCMKRVEQKKFFMAKWSSCGSMFIAEVEQRICVGVSSWREVGRGRKSKSVPIFRGRRQG